MSHSLTRDAAGVPSQAPPHIVFIALLVMLTLLISAVGGYASYSRLRDEQHRETERTLTVIAEQKVQAIESWLARNQDEARLYFSDQALLVQRLAAWEAGGRQDVTLLDLARERIADVMEVRDWSSLAVLDAQGEPIFTLGPENFAPHAQEIQDALAHPRLLSLDLYLNAQGQSEYGLLAPITLPDGRLLGVVYLSWLADQTLFPLITSWPVPTETAETYLVRREGDELLYLTPLRHEPNAALRKRLPLATPHLAGALAALSQEGILPEARDYRNEPVLAYVTAIAGSPWVMIAKIDQREAQAGIRKITLVTALILALTLLLISSTAFTWWRRDQDRVLALVREANARLESELSWKLALDSGGHGVWDWHLDTNRVDYSPTWKHMLGYDEADIGDTLSAWERLVHPEDLARVLATVQAYLAGETPRYECEHRVRCKDGHWKWILDRGTALERDTAGQPLRLVGTHTDITAQKEAEAALRASEERFRYAMEATSDGIWDWNLHSDKVYFSPGWARMLGYAPEELAADLSTWAALLHPEERDQMVARSRRLLADPGHYELEFRLRTKAGDYRWVLSRAKVVEWGSDGTPQRAVGTHVDINERKARELELHRYQQTVENASDMLLFLDRDLRYRIVNPAFAAWHHTTPDQLHGRRVADLVSPEVYARISPDLEAAMTGEPRNHTLPLPDATGQSHWFEGSVRPFVQDGAVAGLVVCLHDLTELYEAQAALEAERASLEKQVRTRTAELRDSETRARAFMNTAQDGVVVIDSDSRILEFNPAAETLFGYRAAEIVGQSLARLMPSQVGTHHAQYVQSSTLESVRLMGGIRQVLGRTKDGQDFPAAISVGTLGDGAGRLHVGIIRDITQQLRQETALREAKEAAEAAAQANSEFLAHMSHEIRAPMNAVLGLAQLLNRESLSADQHDMVQRIQGAGQSLLRIINDILDFSKIEAG